MGSSRQTEENRSLNNGISLPQWMKGKLDNKFDFDESGVLFPPYHSNGDQSFIKNRRLQNSKVSQLPEQKPTDATTSCTNEQTITVRKEQINISEQPCQSFISVVNNKGDKIVSEMTQSATYGNKKTDDGEAGLYSKSIVHVANQVMSTKFAKVFLSDSQGSQQTKEQGRDLYSVRNIVSKSLPATPITSPTVTPDSSPKVRRKVIHSNRYFTGPFVPDKEKYHGSWILGSLLGQSREIVTTRIEEENELSVEPDPRNMTLNRKKSISSQNLTYVGKESSDGSSTSVLENKASELREMNCWSPTSM